MPKIKTADQLFHEAGFPRKRKNAWGTTIYYDDEGVEVTIHTNGSCGMSYEGKLIHMDQKTVLACAAYLEERRTSRGKADIIRSGGG